MDTNARHRGNSRDPVLSESQAGLSCGGLLCFRNLVLALGVGYVFHKGRVEMILSPRNGPGFEWAIREGREDSEARYWLDFIGWDEYAESLKQRYPEELLAKYRKTEKSGDDGEVK